MGAVGVYRPGGQGGGSGNGVLGFFVERSRGPEIHLPPKMSSLLLPKYLSGNQLKR